MQQPISRMELRKKAQRGHPQAIAFFLNHALKQREMEAKVLRKQETLHILLESADVSERAHLIALIQGQLRILRLETPLSINLYARQRGHQQLSWQVRLPQPATSGAIAQTPATQAPKPSKRPPQQRASTLRPAPTRRPARRNSSPWKWLLLFLGMVLIAVGGLYYYWERQPKPEILQIPVPRNAAASIDRRDFFATAVNYATNAATLTQTARSHSEWQLVACYWERAIAAMGSVPIYHPRWELAQQKIVEYQRNFTYAQLQGSQAPKSMP